MDITNKISTGIKNLDMILNGGIPKYSLNIIGGPPGTGKTILAQQIIFNNASAKNRVPYLITTSEPTIKMLRYQQEFTFFDREKVDQGAVMYLNIADAVQNEGLPGVTRVIKEYVEKYSPAILGIDSFKAIHDMSQSAADIREFGYNLTNVLAISECTSFLIGEYEYRDIVGAPIFAIADGIIMMESERQGLQDVRYINIIKMRGDGYFRGRHPFTISRDGIEVYPRIKTPDQPLYYEVGETRIPTGIEGFDAMMQGGFPNGSVTLVAGGSGVGKTLTGLHFITEGVRLKEPGVYVSFQETPGHLNALGKGFGWNLDEMQQTKLLKLLYTSPVEMSVDQHTMVIKNCINDIGAKRVVIDSLSDIEIATPDKVRYRDYVYSLVNYFRAQGITSLLTTEIPELFGTLQLSSHGISFVSDNIILLRYVELGSRITRAISILKMRGSDHDKTMKEFEITSKGLQVLSEFEGAQGLMSGSPTLYGKDSNFQELLRKMSVSPSGRRR